MNQNTTIVKKDELNLSVNFLISSDSDKKEVEQKKAIEKIKKFKGLSTTFINLLLPLVLKKNLIFFLIKFLIKLLQKNIVKKTITKRIKLKAFIPRISILLISFIVSKIELAVIIKVICFF